MLTSRQLQAFKAVIDAGSVVRAAEIIGLSQPAVSRLLSDLESNIGYRLFDRRRGRLTALAEARELYVEVERSYIGLARIEEAAERIGRRKSTHIRIAAIPAMTTGPLTTVAARFLNERPELYVSLETRTRPQILDGVADGMHDIGLASLPVERPDIGVLPLPSVTCVCMVPIGHPLSERDVITVHDLDGEPCIMGADRTPLRLRIGEILADAGVRLDVRAEVTTAEAGAALTVAGVGICLGWGFTLDNLPKTGVRYVRFHPTIPGELAILYLASRPPDGILAEFVTAVMDAAEVWQS